MSERQIANVDQADYWRSETGAKWVEMSDTIDIVLTGVLDRLLAEADIQPGQRVLDIGCGTGASVLALSRRVGPEGAVEGTDIAEQMLDRARQRATAAGAGNVTFTLADAQVHRFAPRSFDRAVSRFGVMFFDDTVAALANIARALKPGGRMTFATWGPMPANPWFSIPRAAAVAQVGDVAPVDPNAPGPMAFDDTERVLGLFRQAGLTEARAEVVNVPMCPPGDAAAVASMLTGIGPASRIMTEKAGTPADAQAIADRVAAALQDYVTPQGIRVPSQLNYYSATVS